MLDSYRRLPPDCHILISDGVYDGFIKLCLVSSSGQRYCCDINKKSLRRQYKAVYEDLRVEVACTVVESLGKMPVCLREISVLEVCNSS